MQPRADITGMKMVDVDLGLSTPVETASVRAILGRIGAHPTRRIEGGGSPAITLQALLGDELVAVKVLVPGRNRWIEGHDLSSFLAKVDHHAWLRRAGGPLGALYPDLVSTGCTAGSAWIAMEWCEGSTLAEVLLDGPCSPQVRERRLRGVVDALVEAGYMRPVAMAAAPDALGPYLGRVRRRLTYLSNGPLAPLANASRTVVNGIDCPNPLTVLERVERTPSLVAAATPGRLRFPVHGDLNLRNVLLDVSAVHPGPRMRLLDPRGEIRPWDPLYDIGKMAFSLTAYEPLVRGAFRATVRHGRACPAIRIEPGPAWLRSLDAALALRAALATSPQMQMLLVDEADWERRLTFVHACHALSEAACRVSILSGVHEAPARDLALAQAVALYGIGTLALVSWAAGVDSCTLLGLVQCLSGWLAAAAASGYPSSASATSPRAERTPDQAPASRAVPHAAG